MDYLKWELERQRRALWALLGGAERREDGEDAQEAARHPAETGTAWRNAARRDGETARGEVPADAGGEEARGAVRRASRDRPRGEDGALKTPEGAWRRALAAETLERETLERETLERAAADRPAAARGGERAERPLPETARPAAPGETAARPEEAPRRTRGGERQGGLGRSGTGAAAGGPGERGTAWAPEEQAGPWGERASAALRAEDGARALSRAVQRDARRYDGGFTLY